MPTTVYFKICQKGEAFHRFERLKPYLQDKEYLALKLIKKKLSLLKIYLKEGHLPSEAVYDFKTFQVSEVDISSLEYKGYLEIEHRGIFETTSYLNLKESLLELHKFLEVNGVELSTLQRIIHECGQSSHSKAIEICGCSRLMQNYYFKGLKQSFQTQVIDENFISTCKGLGQSEFIWVNGSFERNEMLMPFYMGDFSEDFAKSSRLFVKAHQVIFIFVDNASGYFPSVNLFKEMNYLPLTALHPLTWKKVFCSQDPNNSLHGIEDPLPESSLQEILPPPPLTMNEVFLECRETQSLFEQLDDLLPDEPNEENMKYFEDLMQTTSQDPFIFNIDDVCLTCFQTRDQGCHCHEPSCEFCFSL